LTVTCVWMIVMVTEAHELFGAAVEGVRGRAQTFNMTILYQLIQSDELVFIYG
jgi:hypothetical protein